MTYLGVSQGGITTTKMKTTTLIHKVIKEKASSLKVLEGMTSRQGFDVVIFRTKLQDKLRKIETILND
jgi:hypothetical protein